MHEISGFTAVKEVADAPYKRTATLKSPPKLTQEELKELVIYCPDTGNFTWKVQRGRQKAGDPAGARSEALGYVLIGVNGVRHYAHRPAWLYVYGYWPDNVVDHKDNNGFNNRIKNLQILSQGQNILKSVNPNRTKGSNLPMGVYTSKACPGKFLAKISVKRGSVHLGVHTTPESAYEAFKKAKLELHGVELPELAK